MSRFPGGEEEVIAFYSDRHVAQVSRRRRERRSLSRAAKQGPGGARRFARAVRLGVVVLVGVATVALVWTRQRARPVSANPTILPMPLDSILIAYNVADSASIHEDWAKALELNERVYAALPRHPQVLRKMALALQNSTNVRPSGEGGSPSHLYRSSLERSAASLRALALLDSAVAYSRNRGDTVMALYLRSKILSREGLAIEQLRVLEQAIALAPGEPTLAADMDLVNKRLASGMAADEARASAPLEEHPR